MLSSLAVSGSQYGSSNEMKTYLLDGAQPGFLGKAVAHRFTLIEAQWKVCGHENWGIFGNTFSILSIARRIAPISKAIIFHKGQREPEKWEKFAERFIDIATDFELGIDKFMNHFAPMMELICAVSAVALIVFGHTAAGMIGLLAFALSVVKQQNYLPAILDDILTPLAILASFYGIWISPTFILFRIIALVFNADDLIRYLSTCPFTKGIMPDFLTTKSLGKHVINEKLALKKFMGDADSVEKHLKGAYHLRFNPTSFHNESVEKVIPPDINEGLSKVSYKKLYEDLEDRIERLDIKIKNKKGWNILKRSMIKGTCPDARPANFGFSQNLVKALLDDIYKEEDCEIFEERVQELAELGAQCSEGWLREMSFMFNPNAKDYKYHLHRIFAVYRGNLLRNALNTMASEIRRGRHMDPKLKKVINIFDVIGGENNTHLLAQLEAGLAHRWMSFGAAVHYQSQGRGPLTRLLQEMQKGEFKEPLADHEAKITDKELWKAILLGESQVSLPLPMPALVMTAEMDRRAKRDLDIENLVGLIYDAMKPEYRFVQTETGRKRIPVSQIPWTVMENALGDIAKQEDPDSLSGFETAEDPFAEGFDAGAAIGYNRLLVERDDSGTKWLSKEGIKLVLWNMGILESNPNPGKPVEYQR